MRKVSKIAFAYASLVADLHLTHTHTYRVRETDKQIERGREIVRVAPDAGEWQGKASQLAAKAKNFLGLF